MNKDLLESDLVRDEGEVLHVYPDSLGFLTIGVGRLLDKRKGGGISHEESMVLLSNDIDKVCGQLDTALPWWRDLTEPRQRALANMAFNLGIDNLVGFKNTLAMLKAGDYNGAADGMLHSKWATQVGDRAKRLSEMVRNG